MATLEQIMDVETEVESCFSSFLQTAFGTAATAYAGDSNANLYTPRVGVVSTLVEQGNHQVTVPTGTYVGRAIYDQFRVRLDLELTYDPTYGQGQANVRSKLRVALTDFSGIQSKFNQNAYLRLAPTTLRQIDGSRQIDDEAKTETINTVLEAQFFINYNTLSSLS